MPQLTEASRERRRSRIGASELGALFGWHPWTDPARIYARIVDGDQPVQTASMGLGHVLENAIAREAAARLNLEAMACSRTYVHDALPIAATPDYYARELRRTVGGIAPIRHGRYTGLLEVKLSTEWSWWIDGPPPWYEWQVRAQMALTGRRWGVIAAVIVSRLETFQIEHDPDKWAEAEARVAAFQSEHLTPRIPPGTDREDLVLRWTLRPGEIIAEGQLAGVGDRYAELVRARRRAEAQEKEERAAFVALIGATGARVVLGQGWNAATDDRGVMRFTVSRK